MLTREERKREMESLEGGKAFHEKRIAEINKLKNEFSKKTVFEDTYLGWIRKEEQEAQEAINEIMKDLRDVTGFEYRMLEVEIESE